MAIEVINPIAVTDAQAKAIRKLSLRDSKHSTNELSAILFGRAIKNTFTPLVKTIATDARKRYEMSIAGGFPAPFFKNSEGKDVVITVDEYVKRAVAEYKEILDGLTDL